MASLRPALESYGIVLPEPGARRLLAALDAPEGWSGGEGRHLHANGLVLAVAFHRRSDATPVPTPPTPLLRLRAPQAFPEMLPDHPGVADPPAEAHPHAGWRIGFLRVSLRGVLPDDAAVGQALDAAAGPATRARLLALCCAPAPATSADPASGPRSRIPRPAPSRRPSSDGARILVGFASLPDAPAWLRDLA